MLAYPSDQALNEQADIVEEIASICPLTASELSKLHFLPIYLGRWIIQPLP